MQMQMWEFCCISSWWHWPSHLHCKSDQTDACVASAFFHFFLQVPCAFFVLFMPKIQPVIWKINLFVKSLLVYIWCSAKFLSVSAVAVRIASVYLSDTSYRNPWVGTAYLGSECVVGWMNEELLSCWLEQEIIFSEVCRLALGPLNPHIPRLEAS